MNYEFLLLNDPIQIVDVLNENGGKIFKNSTRSQYFPARNIKILFKKKNISNKMIEKKAIRKKRVLNLIYFNLVRSKLLEDCGNPFLGKFC